MKVSIIRYQPNLTGWGKNWSQVRDEMFEDEENKELNIYHLGNIVSRKLAFWCITKHKKQCKSILIKKYKCKFISYKTYNTPTTLIVTDEFLFYLDLYCGSDATIFQL
jgi:hypothetical protein